MKLKLKKIDKMSDDLVVGDEFRAGGLLLVIAKKATNAHGQYVLHCGIVGSTTKKRNQAIFIVPDKTPFTTLE